MRIARIYEVFAALVTLALVMPAQTFASPSGALREYKAGKYDEALKDYEQLLQRKSDDPRLHFNAGAAAYRSQQFEQAAKQFNETLASPTSPDLKLQELAYYNRGNSLYRLGERNPDPAKKTESWEQAVKDFESSLALDPQDADAKFNRAFVKKRLEELKQQQQQQTQQKNIEPSEAAKTAKADADEAVRRREYARALEIMESWLQKDPSTAYYSDYIQRLKEINGVQTGISH